MEDDVRKYFEEQYKKSKIRVVPGHWPDFKSKKEVDEWIAAGEQMSCYFELLLQKQGRAI